MKRHESMLDLLKKTLDPEVFNIEREPPILLVRTRLEILEKASYYSRWGKIKQVFLIGSILTKRWNKKSDLDVTLVIEPFSKDSFTAAKKYSVEHQDKILLSETQHPINCYARAEEAWTEWDDVYDILADKWLKQTEVKPKSVEEYLDIFRKYLQNVDLDKGELKRDLVDYNELSQFSDDEIANLQSRVQQKTKEIDLDVKKLVTSYKVIWTLRRIEFTKEISPEELRDYKSKNLLPSNVCYKLLEKYFYFQLLKALGKVLKRAGGKIDTGAEVKDIVKTLKGVDDEEIESAIDKIVNKSSINELTTSGSCGAYELPLGMTPYWKRKRKKKKKKKVV